MINISVCLAAGAFVFQKSRPLRAKRMMRARPSPTLFTVISLRIDSPTPASVQPLQSMFKRAP
jgi:hypothetical protein